MLCTYVSKRVRTLTTRESLVRRNLDCRTWSNYEEFHSRISSFYNKAVPGYPDEIKMDEAGGEVQFRCKLCQFIGAAKSEIAQHFLSEHIEVEYITPTKKGKKADGKSDEGQKAEENEDKKKKKKKKEKVADKVTEEEEVNFSPKLPSKKRGRPKGKKADAVKTKNKVLSPEPANLEDEPKHLGRGMRKRKKRMPLGGTNNDDVDESDDGEDDVEEDDQINILEDEKGEQKETKKSVLKIKSWDIKSRRGRPRKKERRAHRKKDRNWTATDVESKKERRLKKQKLDIVVPTKVFKRILRDRTDEWQKTYNDKHSLDLYRCEVERCHGIGMAEAEFDVHMKCHVPNMEGFRCFICQFMCLHWRNMRHHYRKVHDQMLTWVSCDFEGCRKEFPKFGALKTHVALAHIKTPLVQKLKPPGTDLSEFSSYLDKKVKVDSYGANVNTEQNNVEDEEEEDEEEPRRRGRPRKRKRPVGRPSKETEPPVKKQNLHHRMQGEDREKFQRRLVAFVCEVCTAKFNEEEKMTEHSHGHYRTGSNEIHCTECEEFVTSEQSSLQLHMVQEHKRLLQLHRCDRCNFSSNRFHDLKKHNIVHTGAKNYMCDKCGKCTTTPYNLKVHYRRMHALDEEKNIKCITCDYRCADKAVLKDHIRQKHGLLINGDEYTNPRSMLMFPCPQCPYVGRKQSSLDYHMRIHNENRQFKCNLCPYASKTKNNLVLHLRTHDGYRPMKCPHCDFRGATNKIISEHVMCKHANIRPYHCSICGWSTAYSGNMWKHMDTHQKELKDKMPECPVNIVNSNKHSIPAPLRPPSGKKRNMSKASNFKLKLAKTGKTRRQKTQPMEQTTTISILQDRDNIQAIQVQAGGSIPEGVLMEVPVHTVLGSGGQMMVTKGLSEEESVGSSALSRLAAAVASQEVHIIQNNDGIQDGSQHQEHRIIATRIDNPIPTSIHVDANNAMDQVQEIIEYTVPSVAQHIITSSGDITEVITADHHYHAGHHIGNHQQLQQQQRHHQQQQQQGGDSSIQQAAVHAGIPTTSANDPVPISIVEQVVPHSDDQSAVRNLVASMIPHDAELVMSMMQIQQVPQHVQQVQQVSGLPTLHENLEH
ncbi:uncharacterized protein LOC121407097 [Lytechinus variegatus]|uniref:uncharacterized protein LOC121407097 n=1 Tax=Lytechinus variegatus TaxID=7654 RepID=UPI001BB0F6F1|nr:uncharacterized protein LOC121407097 [Lytechinus variegatus]